MPEAVRSPAPSMALQAECTARTATELKAGLLAVLDAPEAVGINAAAVERVDTVSLQLLVAFARDRRQAGRAVTWQDASEPFRQAAMLLGLAPVLDLSSRN